MDEVGLPWDSLIVTVTVEVEVVLRAVVLAAVTEE